MVRAAVAAGNDITGLVPATVVRFINDNKMYKK
jgi:nicotinic acid mononucleotide adenylyltransferase